MSGKCVSHNLYNCETFRVVLTFNGDVKTAVPMEMATAPTKCLAKSDDAVAAKYMEKYMESCTHATLQSKGKKMQ